MAAKLFEIKSNPQELENVLEMVGQVTKDYCLFCVVGFYFQIYVRFVSTNNLLCVRLVTFLLLLS